MEELFRCLLRKQRPIESIATYIYKYWHRIVLMKVDMAERESIPGFVVCLMVMALICSGCAEDRDTILELKDVQFFQVLPINSSAGSIKLSGVPMHSALAIRDISTSQHDETLQVFVHLTLVRDKLSGDLNYNLDIPVTVNTVTFGNENDVIWKRGAGEVESK